MLQLSGLARSTFYYYIQHPIKDKYKKEKQEILYIFLANKGRYDYRRILIVLRQKGYTINHKTVLHHNTQDTAWTSWRNDSLQ